jgi:selenocysteine lyase/cysteine desulfurase
MLASQRALFDMPRHICYLNSASYSPLPLRTQEAARAAVGRKGRPWTLDAAFANDQHERARAAAARLINADPADMALIPSISYGVATAAKVLTIARGTRVIVLEDDHSSPVLEWQTRADAQGFAIETIRRPDDGDWTSAVLASIERSAAPPVSLASISSVHWSDGGLIDIEKVGAALRRRGASFLIDATHSAGVLAMDVARIDPDFVIFPTYKWLLGRTAGRFSTLPNAIRAVSRWSRPRSAAGTCAPRTRPISRMSATFLMRGASTWASATTSFRWRWPRSVWK